MLTNLLLKYKNIISKRMKNELKWKTAVMERSNNNKFVKICKAI